MIYIDNTGLAFLIVKQLIELGIRNSIFPLDGKFTDEEIKSIKKITLTAYDSLQDIDKLVNLESLCITCGSLSEEFIENDYRLINNLISLTSLSIIGVSNMRGLNLESLCNLKKLILVNNDNLKKIEGLSELTQLEQVIICGNDLTTFDDPIKYIENTSNAQQNILDVNLYHQLFAKSIKNRKFLESKINSQWSNIKFGEMLEFNSECFVLDFYQMQQMYNKAKSILSKLNLCDDDDMKKVFKIYNYIVENTSYNDKGIIDRDAIYKENNGLFPDNNEYLRRRLLVMNSSYSAIMSGHSVCDGYVNMMKFLLNICGINSKKVLCSLKKGMHKNDDHVIIRVEVDGEWVYADPEREQVTLEIDLFGLSYDEIQNTHNLSLKEIRMIQFDRNSGEEKKYGKCSNI